jgi:hypothetical protein
MDTFLIMAVQVLKRRPGGHVSIRCRQYFDEVSATAVALIDTLKMFPSWKVSVEPEVVTGFVGMCELKLER